MNNDDYFYEHTKMAFKKTIMNTLNSIILYEKIDNIPIELQKELIPITEEEHVNKLEHHLEFKLNKSILSRIFDNRKNLKHFFNVLYELYCLKYGEFTNTDIYNFLNTEGKYIKGKYIMGEYDSYPVNYKFFMMSNIDECSHRFALLFDDIYKTVGTPQSKFDLNKLLSSIKGTSLKYKVYNFCP